eukprot:284818138_4
MPEDGSPKSVSSDADVPVPVEEYTSNDSGSTPHHAVGAPPLLNHRQFSVLEDFHQSLVLYRRELQKLREKQRHFRSLRLSASGRVLPTSAPASSSSLPCLKQEVPSTSLQSLAREFAAQEFRLQRRTRSLMLNFFKNEIAISRSVGGGSTPEKRARWSLVRILRNALLTVSLLSVLQPEFLLPFRLSGSLEDQCQRLEEKLAKHRRQSRRSLDDCIIPHLPLVDEILEACPRQPPLLSGASFSAFRAEQKRGSMDGRDALGSVRKKSIGGTSEARLQRSLSPESSHHVSVVGKDNVSPFPQMVTTATLPSDKPATPEASSDMKLPDSLQTSAVGVSAPKPNGLFGVATQASSAATKVPTSGLFGGPTADKSVVSEAQTKPGGLFGIATQASSAATKVPTSGLFGGPTADKSVVSEAQTKPGGLFGVATQSSSAATKVPTSGLFGGPTADKSVVSEAEKKPGGLFGVATQSSSAAPTVPTSGLFGGPTADKSVVSEAEKKPGGLFGVATQS